MFVGKSEAKRIIINLTNAPLAFAMIPRRPRATNRVNLVLGLIIKLTLKLNILVWDNAGLFSFKYFPE